jgi:hypothetical protein
MAIVIMHPNQSRCQLSSTWFIAENTYLSLETALGALKADPLLSRRQSFVLSDASRYKASTFISPFFLVLIVSVLSVLNSPAKAR